jgi:hypothetical protein
MLPQDSLRSKFFFVGGALFYARFLCNILFSPHRQHSAMQILVHVDVALHRLHINLHTPLLLLYGYLPIPYKKHQKTILEVAVYPSYTIFFLGAWQKRLF